jgi:hypothetical protein
VSTPISRLFKTLLLLVLLLLLSACIVTPAPILVLDTETPTITPTATQVWFPPTFTPSPLPPPDFTPTPDLRPGIGELLLEDDFSDETAWSLISSSDTTVNISENEIHLSLNDDRQVLISTRTEPVFNDFYAEITASASFCRGTDEYGFVVRASEDGHYRFALACNGSAKVDRLLGDSVSRQAGWLANPVVPSFAPSTVRLGVWGRGSQLHFFVNDVFLFSVNDTQLWRGTLGVFVHTSGDGDVSVNFSDLKVWALTPAE